MAEVRRPRDPSSGIAQHVFASIGATIFEVGSVLGGRYEIQKLLGMGGMGAVYKAHDLEVDRAVGLKVIRPDLAGNPAILARFKQELVLARQVTHKNIIRIYDLSEAEGVKFITMEFIEGEDLRTILTRDGKLAPKEAMGIISQVCAGLQAAHHEGVIHRDLKPSNIMRDAAGRVVIMDFGLAKTVQSDGMTQTGMMIGTMEYMSPEQAMGSELDARSDIFAVGLIFYELITGNMPYRAESAIASLVMRTQKRAIPLSDVDPTVPVAVSQIVAKCLERDPANRYHTVQEMLDDLDIAQGRRPRSSGFGQSAVRRTAFGATPAVPTVDQASPPTEIPPAVAVPRKRFAAKWMAVGIAAILLIAGVGGYFALTSMGGAGQQGRQAAVTSLAILPYYNASGDPSLNWLSSTLAETVGTDLGRSSHVRLVSPSRLQQVLKDLGITPGQQVDPSTLKRIADFTSADTVVFGKYVKVGDQIRINSSIDDLKHDRHLDIATDVPSEKELLSSMETLAKNVRDQMGASSPSILGDLGRSYPLTKSVPALRAYNEGLQFARASNYSDAAKKFEEAVNQDPDFALAYSQLAQSYKALGYDDKAEQTSRQAVSHADNLPAQEKYLIEANHAGLMNDTAKAVAAYENLTKVKPDDIDAQFALAKLYEDSGNYDAARDRLAKVRAGDNSNADAFLASGRVEIRAGKPQAGLEFLNRAYSLAAQFQNDVLKAAVLQAQGIAYGKLNQPKEALKDLQEALSIRRNLGLQSAIGASLNEIAGVQDKLGDSGAALASYKEALAIREKIGDKSGTATVLLNLGSFYHDHANYPEALKYFNDALTRYRELNNQPRQALCLNNIGSVRENMGDYQDALTYFQQAYNIREQLKQTADMAESLHNLAETNVKLGQYDTALSQFLKALEYGRSTGDQARVALESSSLGELFATQGKYGSSLESLQEAIKGFNAVNDRTFLMASTLARYGNTLALVGRQEEGQRQLEEALKLAAEVKNDRITAEALNWMGDSYFYAGDYNSARQQYEKAASVAAKGKDREQIAVTKFNLARLDVVQGRSGAAVPALQKLTQDTDSIGLRALSVQSSIYLAQALLANNKAGDALQELDRAMNRAEKLGLLIEQARGHYLLGDLLTSGGRTKEYVPQYREAVRLLESISKQNGVGRLLDRFDLKDVYRDAIKSYQGSA